MLKDLAIRIVGTLVLLAVFEMYVVTSIAEAQTLPACSAMGTATPIPRNEARVEWTAPTAHTDGSPLPAGVQLVYTVYRRTGTTGSFTAQCTVTAALGVSMLNQPVGEQWYTATARYTGSLESMQASPPAMKTITAPQPNAPTIITVR